MQTVRNGWLRLGATLVEHGLISEQDATRVRAWPISTDPHVEASTVDLGPFRSLAETQSLVETVDPPAEKERGLYSGLREAVGHGGPADGFSTPGQGNTQPPVDGLRPGRLGAPDRPAEVEARAGSLQGRLHDLRVEAEDLRVRAEKARQGIATELLRLDTLAASLGESEAALEKMRIGWMSMLSLVSSFHTGAELHAGSSREQGQAGSKADPDQGCAQLSRAEAHLRTARKCAAELTLRLRKDARRAGEAEARAMAVCARLRPGT
jgi:hypothetical protein